MNDGERSALMRNTRRLQRQLQSAPRAPGPELPPTERDTEVAREVTRLGFKTSPGKAAFTRQWQLVGGSPTLERAEKLRRRIAAMRRIDPDRQTRLAGNDKTGWTIYVSAPSSGTTPNIRLETPNDHASPRA